jgi:hypothetical protein
MIGHNIESVRGGLYNIRRFNQILERKDIILGDVLPTRGGIDNNEVYKGYHFSRSIATDAKELIDIRNELVNTIEEDYALATFENITNCSNRSINKTDFIFEQFVKDKLAKTFKSYTKEKSLTTTKDIKHFKYLIIIIKKNRS